MDNKSTTKRMIGAVVLVLIAALLLAWLLKGKNQSVQEQQDLIADQTNQSSNKILGFPGVQEGEGEQAAQDGETPYVIGDADTKQEGGAGDATQQQATDAGQSTDGTGTGVAATVAGAATSVVTAGKEAAQNVADGFKVRDSDEQRQVVADGKAKAGVGSMGTSELALPKKSEVDAAASAGTAGDANTVQQAQQTQSAEQAAPDTQAPAKAQQSQTASSSGSSGSDSAAQQQPAAPKKPAASVKLVGEKPVPAPRSQSSRQATSSSSDGSSSSTVSASSGSSSSSSQSASTGTGGKGYAIQVLAASSPGTAEQVRKSIAVDGYPVFVVQARVNSKTVYRVRVGTYPARNAARAVQTKMKARYTKNKYVQNSFVTRN